MYKPFNLTHIQKGEVYHMADGRDCYIDRRKRRYKLIETHERLL